MNIDKVLSKYCAFYNNRSYSDIATLIRESELSIKVKYSHRTLRRKISEFLATQNNQIKEEVVETPVESRPQTITWNEEKVIEYFKNQKGFNQEFVDNFNNYKPHSNTLISKIQSPYSSDILKIEKTKDVKDLMIISDLHGVYLDEKCFNVFLKVLADNQPDELVLNGDIEDFPFLSKHNQKLIKSGALEDYSEIGEIEIVKNKILKRLRDVAPHTNIVFRLGNHTERVTNPYNLTQSQLGRLAVVYNYYNTTKYEEMLELESMNIEYDDTPVRNYHGVFDVIHGLSLSKNASEKNILDRFSSGTSGHSHRGSVFHFNKGEKYYSWVESGHMRTQTNVEYLPTAVSANWVQGFVTVKFDLSNSKPKFFAKFNPIINGVTEYHGKIYK